VKRCVWPMTAILLMAVTVAAQWASARDGLRVAVESHAPMSLEHAMRKVPVPNHVRKALIQTRKAQSQHVAEQEAALRAEFEHAASSTNALDRAKDTLNAMMEGTEEELDTALLECKEFEAHATANLDENQQLRASIAEEVADARAELGDAQQTAHEARLNLEQVKQAAADAAEQCEASRASAEAQLSLLEADLEVGEKVLNMTECQGSADGSSMLLQCGSASHPVYRFAGSEKLKAFQSPAAMLAAQRAAKMALGRTLGPHAYVVQGGKRMSKRVLSQKRKQDPSNRQEPPDADDVAGLEDMEVAALPPPPELSTDVGKCSVAGSTQCPMIRDSLSQLVSEIRWAKDEASHTLAAVQAECERLATEYKQQADDFQHALDTATVAFARATGRINANEEALRLKVTEANELTAELTAHREACAAKIKEGAETLCGIRTIRQELFQMAGEIPTIQDCEVSEWAESECSVTCGGGERTLSRTVVVPADGGAQCPPLTEMEACATHPCPIDGICGDWSGWSACSKDCGGGLMQRSRIETQEAEHGGEPCGALVEPAQCNTESCDRPCDLGDWNDWSACSKDCDGGYRLRFRDVTREAGPTGHCPAEHDPERMHEEACNTFLCPPDLTCVDEMDLMILVDGSGSVEWTPGGWENEKKFVDLLLDHLSFGEAATKAGVVLFSWEVETIQQMTTDKAAVEAAVEGMSWPGWNTDTAGALSRAGLELTNGGRAQVPKAKTVAFLITDGNPNDMTAANSAAETLKERARLVIVPVGGYVDMDAIHRWASFPPEQNVLPVEEFEMLPVMLSEMLSSVCSRLECDESFTGNGQDYHGCQSVTREGYTCQGWTAQYPHSHGYLPWNFPDARLGDHNFCRNPDGDSAIWCVTADPNKWWDYCDPRDTTDIPRDYHPQM